jgi:hypothetical protein
MEQRYELSKQLQDLHVDVSLYLKPHERFFNSFIEPTATWGEKAELPLRLEEAFPIAM